MGRFLIVMLKKLKKEIEDNERAFYATLCSFCVLLIELVYVTIYDSSPSPIVLMFPILFWITYHGNRHEPATYQGYWIWVTMLVIVTLITLIYPLF